MNVFVITHYEGCLGVFSTREKAIARIKKLEFWENPPDDWTYDPSTSEYEIEEWTMDEGPSFLQ
jgi:hypothetical protein